MRLIDADALAAEMLDTYGADAGSEDVTAIYGMVINAPTVDAVPVRHGRWERCSARIAGWVKCSECGNMEPPLCATRFCGHCGVLMEEYDEAD